MRWLVSRVSSAAGWIVVFVVFAAPRPATAGPLLPINFTSNGPAVQDLDSGVLNYNATTHDFNFTDTNPFPWLLITPAYSIPSNPNFFTPPGLFDVGMAASLSIDLSVNNSGQLIAGGTGFTLFGAVDIDGDTVDDPKGTTAMTLLTGTIKAFGTNGPGPAPVTFNGLFQVTGGLLSAPLTLSNNDHIGALFVPGSLDGFTITAETVTSGILGNFASNFGASPNKVYAGAFVPEPSGLVLVLSGATTVCGYVLMRRRFAAARP
jgi:hypothetical protein